jgi:hypothetical protein
MTKPSKSKKKLEWKPGDFSDTDSVLMELGAELGMSPDDLLIEESRKHWATTGDRTYIVEEWPAGRKWLVLRDRDAAKKLAVEAADVLIYSDPEHLVRCARTARADELRSALWLHVSKRHDERIKHMTDEFFFRTYGRKHGQAEATVGDRMAASWNDTNQDLRDVFNFLRHLNRRGSGLEYAAIRTVVDLVGEDCFLSRDGKTWETPSGYVFFVYRGKSR